MTYGLAPRFIYGGFRWCVLDGDGEIVTHSASYVRANAVRRVLQERIVEPQRLSQQQIDKRIGPPQNLFARILWNAVHRG